MCWIQIVEIYALSKTIFNGSKTFSRTNSLYCWSLQQHTFQLHKRVWEHGSRLKILVQSYTKYWCVHKVSTCLYSSSVLVYIMLMATEDAKRETKTNFLCFILLINTRQLIQWGESQTHIHTRSEQPSLKLVPHTCVSTRPTNAKCLCHMKRCIKKHFPTHNLLHCTTKEHLLPLSSEFSLLLGSRRRFMISPGNSRQPAKQQDST